MQIIVAPDSRLNQISKKVETIDYSIISTLNQMLECMYKNNGIGLNNREMHEDQEYGVTELKVTYNWEANLSSFEESKRNMRGIIIHNTNTCSESIVVDGGSTLICGATDGSSAAEGDCAFMTDDSTTWDVAEEITIMENGQDLCDGTDGGCDVDVTLTKIGVGNEDDKVIATVDSFADSSA